MATDVFSIVTDRIIDMLEKGDIPWQRPWTGAGRWAVKRATGQPYSLLNQMLLQNPGEYLSFNQCKQEGGKVKKGAKSKIVVFWKILDVVKRDEEGHAMTDNEGNLLYDHIPYLRYSNVFHIDDCEGLEPKTYETTLREFDLIESAEQAINDYLKRSHVGLEHIQQGRAYYSPTEDKVVLPIKEQFTSDPAYYATAFHELTHSTGHSSRLDRFTTANTLFGSDSYSKEELVAEIGSASIMNYLGIETAATITNTAAYIQNWIKALRRDNRLIVSAATKADKAVQMIIPGVSA